MSTIIFTRADMRNTFHLNTMIKQRRRMLVVPQACRFIYEETDIKERMDDELPREDDLEGDEGPAT
jgi:hypothetical protein